MLKKTRVCLKFSLSSQSSWLSVIWRARIRWIGANKTRLRSLASSAAPIEPQSDTIIHLAQHLLTCASPSAVMALRPECTKQWKCIHVFKLNQRARDMQVKSSAIVVMEWGQAEVVGGNIKKEEDKMNSCFTCSAQPSEGQLLARPQYPAPVHSIGWNKNISPRSEIKRKRDMWSVVLLRHISSGHANW